MKITNLLKEVLGAAGLLFVMFWAISQLLTDAIEALRITP